MIYVLIDKNFFVAAKRSVSLFFSHVILLSGDIACMGVPVALYKLLPRSAFFKSFASCFARLSDHTIALPSGTPFLSIGNTLCIAELKQILITWYFFEWIFSFKKFFSIYSMVMKICSGSCSLKSGLA